MTVVRLISITEPSAPYLGISNQSPTESILLAESCTPATKPRIGSLNTNIKTAVIAPKPLSRITGDLPIKIEVKNSAAIINTISLMLCKMPRVGRFLPTWVRLISSSSTLSTE
ncbi:Uncharacterised protein [Vibrio cholerae]|nr:Uncharacterised protein [Vibrio cholerae]